MGLFSNEMKLRKGIRKNILNDLDPFQRSAVKYVASQDYTSSEGIFLPYTAKLGSLQCPEVFHILLREDKDFAEKKLEEMIIREMKQQEKGGEQRARIIGPYDWQKLQWDRMTILDAIHIVYFSKFSSKDDRKPIKIDGFRDDMLAEMLPNLYELFDQRHYSCPLVLLHSSLLVDSSIHLVSVNDIYKKDRRQRIGFIEGLLQY